MDPVGELIDELQESPSRFRDSDGYDRLLELLRQGHAPDALKQLLRENADRAGDLLWTIAELETVDAYVSDALSYLASEDKAAAAYSMEIVLRGAHDEADLRAALDQMRVCDPAVCHQAVQTLAGGGLHRLISILKNAGYTWSSTLAARLSEGISREEIEDLTLDTSRDRQIVGVALAHLAWEQDATYARCFARSDEAWIRHYGTYLDSLPRRTPRHGSTRD